MDRREEVGIVLAFLTAMRHDDPQIFEEVTGIDRNDPVTEEVAVQYALRLAVQMVTRLDAGTGGKRVMVSTAPEEVPVYAA